MAHRGTGTHEILLRGGRDRAVSLVGGTVRRQTGPWTPAVHALLRHLADVGFEEAPRVLGIDEQGREILTYVEGETIAGAWSWPEWTRSAATLTGIARLLRRYHEAVADFRPPAGATWRSGVTGVKPGAATTLRPGEIICHNDVGPYNLVVSGGAIRAVLDWDMAGPAPAAWDVALAAWQVVPLHPPDQCRRLGWAGQPDQAGRLRDFCDAYGLIDRTGFVELIATRIRTSLDHMITSMPRVPHALAWQLILGFAVDLRATLAYLETHAERLQAALD